MKKISIVLLLCLVTSCAFASEAITPIFHKNGVPAWNGDTLYPFYHANAQIAWNGPEYLINRNVYYDNGEIAWKGFNHKERKTYDYTYDICTVYSKNGSKIWQGKAYDECNYDFDPSKIYHANGKVAWYGALAKNIYSNWDLCTAYHSNGKKAWYGFDGIMNSSYSEKGAYFHSNGEIAWRGVFPKDYKSSGYYDLRDYYCGVYHDNKKLAWTGVRGDPLYDRDGKIVSKSVDAIRMPLGDDSFLYVSSYGEKNLFISLGEGNLLVFPGENKPPILMIHLGEGYILYFHPHDKQTPKLSLYGIAFEVKYEQK